MKVRLIKRYAGRRFYDVVALRYLQIEDLRALRERRVRFVVVDSESGENVTLDVLA